MVGNDDEAGADIADLDDHKLVVEAPIDTIFDVVEQNPSFPGGERAMQKWLNDNLRYPAVAAEMGVSGKVHVQFVVGRDGSVRDIEVIRPVDPSLDKEAVRAISKMPKWIPGRQRGNPVTARFTMPVNFVLESQ